MRKIVNLYGGPGTGKSTTCAALFAELKHAGVNAEMCREYVKNWVWEGRKIHPGDTSYFMAKQLREQRNLMRDGIGAIVTDSPLLLASWYGQSDPLSNCTLLSRELMRQQAATCEMYGYTEEHIFLVRVKEYNPKGRLHTEDEAKEIDGKLKILLDSAGKSYHTVTASRNAAADILKILES